MSWVTSDEFPSVATEESRYDYDGILVESALWDPAMGSVPNPQNNALAKGLMGIHRRECVRRKVSADLEQAQAEILECMGTLYDRRRMHSAPDLMSPAEFEAANVGKSRPRAAWDLSTKTRQIQAPYRTPRVPEPSCLHCGNVGPLIARSRFNP